MSELLDRLSACKQEDVVKDIVELVDSEVAKKKGVSGVALRSGYGLVKKLRSGTMLTHSVTKLLPQFTEALSPSYDAFLATDLPTFEQYLQGHPNEASEALLSITDSIAQNSKASNAVIRKTYSTLRVAATTHVKEALPGVGQIIDRYTPRT